MYLAAHVYFYVLTIFNIRFFCKIILHGRVNIKPPSVEGNPLCISCVDAGQTAGAQTVLFTGADVQSVLFPVRLAAQADIHMVEGNIGDIAGGIPVDHDSVFAGAVDVVKEHIADIEINAHRRTEEFRAEAIEKLRQSVAAQRTWCQGQRGQYTQMNEKLLQELRRAEEVIANNDLSGFDAMLESLQALEDTLQ